MRKTTLTDNDVPRARGQGAQQQLHWGGIWRGTGPDCSLVPIAHALGALSLPATNPCISHGAHRGAQPLASTTLQLPVLRALMTVPRDSKEGNKAVLLFSFFQ